MDRLATPARMSLPAPPPLPAHRLCCRPHLRILRELLEALYKLQETLLQLIFKIPQQRAAVLLPRAKKKSRAGCRKPGRGRKVGLVHAREPACMLERPTSPNH